jgi:hypothetical protein
MYNKITILFYPEVANTITPYMAAVLADHYAQRLTESKSDEERTFVKKQLRHHENLSEAQ